MEELKYYTMECEKYGMLGYAHVFALNPENAEATVREFGAEPFTEPIEQAIVQVSRLTPIGKRLLELEYLCFREEGVLEIMIKPKEKE